MTPLSPEVISRQATINIGTIGHVAHGKSTVVKAISGVHTVRFKNELERNITIKLGKSFPRSLSKPKRCNNVSLFYLVCVFVYLKCNFSSRSTRDQLNQLHIFKSSFLFISVIRKSVNDDFPCVFVCELWHRPVWCNLNTMLDIKIKMGQHSYLFFFCLVDETSQSGRGESFHATTRPDGMFYVHHGQELVMTHSGSHRQKRRINRKKHRELD